MNYILRSKRFLLVVILLLLFLCDVSAIYGEQNILSLEKAVTEALKASPELAQMKYRIEAAKSQVVQAASSLLPRLSFSEEYNRTDNPVFALMNIITQRRLRADVDFNDPGAQQNFNTTLQVQWELFRGGASLSEIRASKKQEESLEAELKALRNILVYQTVETYYRWMQAIASLEAAEKAFQSAKLSESIAESRIETGTALKTDLLRCKTYTAETEERLLSVRNAISRFQAGMERLIAREIKPEEVPSLSRFQEGEVYEYEDPGGGKKDDFVRKGLCNRAELKALETLIEAAAYRARASKLSLLPSVGFKGQWGWDSEELVDKKEKSWMLGFQATWPIFEGGLSIGRIREAESRLKELQFREKQLALDISLEITHGVLYVKETREKVKVAAKRLQWSRESLEEVRRLYKNEAASVESLLQAEAAWQEAEASYVKSLFEKKIAEALLQRSLGDFAEGIVKEFAGEGK